MINDIAPEELRENFKLFDDWEDRYRYLIDLGKKLPPFSDDLRSEENRVKGCVSNVWMVSGFRDGRFRMLADSDAHIVRGLVAVLMVFYRGKGPVELRALDIDAVFRDLGLEQHLSPNRRSGFFAMVDKIRSSA